MESDTLFQYPYSATTAPMPLTHSHIAAHINPPASKHVLDRLAGSLTPPHRVSHQARKSKLNGTSRDYARNLAAHKPDQAKLWAYEACAQVINRHSKSFYFSARLLPQGKRHGIMALYAFCRLSDDLVDNADSTEEKGMARARAEAALNQWAVLNSSAKSDDNHPVVVAWGDTRGRFGIPAELADDFIEGIRMDLTIARYDTWDDLWLYCYRVASTVGLMSMYITGADTMDAVPYAVQLGVALQLTNILRDVGEDARAGRIYIPAEDMDRFGYTDEMLHAGEINQRFVDLMEFQMERALALYQAAWPGIAMLPPDSRMAVAAAATLYRGILGKIRAARYDVFSHRAHLSASEKLMAVPSIWWGLKRNVKHDT